MQAKKDDLAALLEVQRIDLEIRRTQKELADLPQRAIIVSAREKKRALEEKRDKVASLKKNLERKLILVGDEDESLAFKQRNAQEAIESSQGGYRNVEARTKELNGFAKRRAVLETQLDELSAEMEKAEELEAQVLAALEDVSSHEASATASFQKQGGALKNTVARFEAQRAALTKNISQDLVQAYEKTLARSGGVALSTLQGSRCGACRATIESGRLLELKSQAPLGVCPACKRLLIIE